MGVGPRVHYGRANRLCLQYVLKGYPRKFLGLLAGTPSHLTLNGVSYHSAESTEEIA